MAQFFIPSADGSAPHQMLIYDVIGETYWMDGVTAKQVVAALTAAESGDVLVRLNSLGGNHQDGTAIFNALAEHSGKVTVRVEGYFCSMGTVIACAGDVVQMYETALGMTHKASTGVMGNADDLRAGAKMLDLADTSIARAYARKSGKTEAEAKEALLGLRDAWQSPEALQAVGIVDEVIVPQKFMALTRNDGVKALADGVGASLLPPGRIPGGIRNQLEGVPGVVGFSVGPDSVEALKNAAVEGLPPVDPPPAPAAAGAQPPAVPPAQPVAPPDPSAVLAAERQRSSDIMAAAKSVGISASSDLVQQAIMNGTPADQVGPMFQAVAAAVDERINSPAPNQPEGGTGPSSVWDRARAGQAGGRK